MMDNTVLDTTSAAAVSMSAPVQLELIDNKIRSLASGPAVTMSAGSNKGSIQSIGNTFTVSSPVSCSGASVCSEINDTTVSYAQVSGSPLGLPTPSNQNRHIIEVPAGANATTIQNAINSAVAYQGQRPVVHLPKGSYSISSTITIPANLDLQLIGDGYGTAISWSGSSGGTMFRLSSPSKALVQDMFLNASNKSDAFLIGTEDVSGSRIQLFSILPLVGQTGIYVEPLTNTRVNVYDLNTTAAQPLIINGTGSPVMSQVAVFAGATGGPTTNTNPYPVLSLSGDANVLFEEIWFESSMTALATLSGKAGNVTIQNSHFNQVDASAPSASVTLNNFAGNFAWLGTDFNNWATTNLYAGPIVITGPNSSTNVLFMGDLFVNLPSYQVQSGGNVYALNNWQESLAGVESPIANQGGTPTNSFMSTIFAQCRTVLPSLNTPLPSGVSDVQISKVQVTNATHAFHVKTGI
jgi:hypothetical protein